MLKATKNKRPKNIKKLAKAATEGRVLLLHALPYMGCFVYILRFDKTLFTYHAIINGQMYFDFIEVSFPDGVERELTEDEVKGYTGMALATAHTTIEFNLNKLKKNEQELGKVVLETAEAVYGDKKKGKNEKN